ncbi:hypothetical protein ISF_08033 [Cordyceps fumosorosea ARSEF 2679]|uniref:Uncharacterized protein n=1 Tax=Cordyceps fumosorosea (strain ARSEF 2679) TaxID=1081104 RepID=A0A167N492_CORFA|nr:hypothetical protein ISF_08033 [Cordyceps fumosorosea ARSEF 2679]OAA55112.1 hypothetical protein ISF_08033 [Cordyceps fumosorosea ARSEF 2679]
MNSTSAAATATTATGLPALTTPFAPPASCTDTFNTTLTYLAGLDSAHPDATHVTVLAASPASRGGCLASGANVHRDGATVVVRPGVCPSAWVAYNLKVDGPQYYPNPSDAASITFEAFCCSSGFSADETSTVIPGFGPACTKLVAQTSAVTAGQTTIARTVSAHAAWQVQWRAADASTLTPAPPSMGLCYDVQVPTWTPGAEATGRRSCRSMQVSPDRHQYDGLLYLAIVLPTVIGFLLIAGCICGCVCYRRKKNRQKREAERPIELPGDEVSLTQFKSHYSSSRNT